jgi:hypothetical protein
MVLMCLAPDQPARTEPAGKEAGRTVLRTRGGVEVNCNPETVLPRPLEGAKDVLPARAGQERLITPDVDGPVRNRQSDPIQSGACNLREILLGLDGKRTGETRIEIR